MIPVAQVAHMSPGRLRVKIPSRKGDAAYFLSLKEHFSHVAGVQSLECNPLTGSVLIKHVIDARSIMELARTSNLFTVSKPTVPPGAVHRSVREGFHGLNQQVKGFTSGAIGLGGLTFLALVGVGLYQIARGNFAAPAWYTAFWYALNIFLKSERPETGQENNTK